MDNKNNKTVINSEEEFNKLFVTNENDKINIQNAIVKCRIKKIINSKSLFDANNVDFSKPVSFIFSECKHLKINNCNFKDSLVLSGQFLSTFLFKKTLMH
jgi:hypothetical protein